MSLNKTLMGYSFKVKIKFLTTSQVPDISHIFISSFSNAQVLTPLHKHWPIYFLRYIRHFSTLGVKA